MKVPPPLDDEARKDADDAKDWGLPSPVGLHRFNRTSLPAVAYVWAAIEYNFFLLKSTAMNFSWLKSFGPNDHLNRLDMIHCANVLDHKL